MNKQKVTLPKQFDFFLDAYWFCKHNNIDDKRIHKVSFKVWEVA